MVAFHSKEPIAPSCAKRAVHDSLKRESVTSMRMPVRFFFINAAIRGCFCASGSCSSRQA